MSSSENIIKKSLTSSEIKLLHNNEVLYVFDLRATSETPEQKIVDFWKYENPMPWILHDQYVVVNEDYVSLSYPYDNKMVIALKEEDPRISLFDRLQNKIPAEIKYLWVGIPHPKADEFAKKHNLLLNYSYLDFVKYNDKLAQKKVLGDVSPDWLEVVSYEALNNLPPRFQEGFFKRQRGSGGYKVYPLKEVIAKDRGAEFFKENIDWYVEERIVGDSYSVQCLKQNNKIIMFGFDQQLIADETHFVGAKIFSLDQLSEPVFRKLSIGINRLKLFLKNYEGFFGLDFIIDKEGQAHILEANVRMTAMTIPIIIATDRKQDHPVFLEDLTSDKIAKNDILIIEDRVRKTTDVLRNT